MIVQLRLVAMLALACLCASAWAFEDSLRAPERIFIEIDGVQYEAQLDINQRLLDRRSIAASEADVLRETARHFAGSIVGFPESRLRLSYGAGRWRGVVAFGGELYRVDYDAGNAFARAGSFSAIATAVKPPMEEQHICDDPTHSSEHLLAMMAPTMLPAELAEESQLPALPDVVASTVGAPDCPDPVDGICLMPELELAYDLSYQTINSPGETVLDRATRELNELDLFFERGFSYRFSRVSMTFLDAAQDAVFASYNSAADLLDELRLARNRGEMPFIQSPRSIFHFMTGRNFPPTAGGSNVVGIAYLDVFCETFGLNTGLTDAGDAFLVSLVMAHEIGHNLGAGHDSTSINGCTANTHVMTASIGPSASSITDFSSCSIGTIQPIMANVLASSNRSMCLDFPVDMSIAAAAGNPVSPPKEEAFTATFSIAKQGGSLGVTTLRVDGVIDDTENGYWQSVSVTGGSCSVTSASYSCTVNNAGSALTLSVQAVVDSEATVFAHTQSVSVIGGDAIETSVGNNSIVTNYTSFTVPTGSSSGGASGGGSSSGASSGSSSGSSSSGGSSSGASSGGSSGSSSSGSTSSSGGGGSIQLPVLLTLLASALFSRNRVAY